MHRRVYGIATGLSAAIRGRISHFFAVVDKKEVTSCLVFLSRRCHPQHPVLNDTAAVLTAQLDNFNNSMKDIRSKPAWPPSGSKCILRQDQQLFFVV